MLQMLKRSMVPTGLRYGAIALLVLGIFLRFYNLDHKVYWLDEVYTSLRLSGHTRSEFVEQVFTGSVVDVTRLQQYQHPTPATPIAATLHSIAVEEPQLTPLYFVLARGWIAALGDSIAARRGLSAGVSLLAFPCLWWLCRQLFPSPQTAWMAIALFAISPLHLLYAQEARPYSLWTVLTLLSSATLLWARRRQTLQSWLVYSLTVALGLYTQLLFGLVAIAHLLYAFLAAPPPDKRPSPLSEQGKALHPLIPLLTATIAATLTLLPWLWVLLRNLDEAQARVASLSEASSWSTVVNQWLVNASRVFVGWDLGPVNILVALGLVYVLYWLSRTTEKSTWLFVVTLVGVGFLGLALPDLLLGGERSTRIRYLIPCYWGMQIALAHFLVTMAIGEHRRTWARGLLLGVISINLAACLVSAQAQVWWNKSVPRSSYYPPVSTVINRAETPLVVTDSRPIDLLALSYWLAPNVRFQLVTDPKALRIARGYESVFLLNPSKRLRAILSRRNYDLELIYNDRNAPEDAEERLWRVRKPE